MVHGHTISSSQFSDVPHHPKQTDTRNVELGHYQPPRHAIRGSRSKWSEY